MQFWRQIFNFYLLFNFGFCCLLVGQYRGKTVIFGKGVNEGLGEGNMKVLLD